MFERINRWVAPPVFADPEKTRVARLSNFLLILIIIVTPLVGIIGLFSPTNPPNSKVVVAIFVLSCIARFLLQRGYVFAANMLSVFGQSSALLFSAFFVGGGVSSGTYGIFFVVVVFAGILLSSRAAILAALTGILFGLGMVYAENRGLLPSANAHVDPLVRWAIYSAGLTLAAFSSYLATRSTNLAIHRLRVKEVELVALNRQLQQEIRDREQRAREQTVPLAMANAMRTAKDRDAIIPAILNGLLDHFGASAAAYATFTGSQDEQVVEQSNGLWHAWSGHTISEFPFWEKHAISSHTIYLDNDLQQTTNTLHLFTLADLVAGVSAAAAIVLEGTEHRLGTLWIGCQRDITAQDLRILSTIASMVTNALQRIQVQDETRRRAEQLATISQLGQFVGETFDIAQICAQIYQTARGLLPDITSLFIELYDPRQHSLQVIYGNQAGQAVNLAQFAPVLLAPSVNNLQQHALFVRQPALLGTVQNHLNGDGLGQSVVYRPMAARGQTVGILQVQSDVTYQFTKTDLEFLTLLANTAAIAIQNALLFDDLQRSNARAQQELYERTQAEAVIRRQLSALETSLDGIALLDQQQNYFYVNQAHVNIYGYTDANELIGQNWRVLYTDDEQKRLEQEALSALLDRGEWHGDSTGKRKDGSIFQQELSLTYLDTGEITCIVRDVTERKDAEEALRRSQRLESLGVMAGGIAHDFNNLLAGVIGQTSLARAKLADDSPARAHLDKAIASSTRAADLTRQLLAYAGKGQVETKQINLNELLNENRSLFETIVPKQVTLSFELSENVPWVEGDIGQIQQVIMNLIMNAAEAVGDRPGYVHVQSQRWLINNGNEPSRRCIGGDILPPGLYTKLSITDNGSGMDRKTLDRIFEPFFSTKGYGRGLGLSATIGIIRTHKGGLRVESQVNQGSTFQVFLPAVPTPTTNPQEQLVVSETTEQLSGTVLIMDDEAAIRDVLVDLLEMHGLQVLTAENGLVGIQVFRQHQQEIGAVVVDMQMPVMNGAEAIRELVKIDPEVELILTSGYSELNLAPELTRSTSLVFLQKPYSLDALIKTVEERIKAKGYKQGIQRKAITSAG
jgi:PAS domain S-box-containing protein